MIPTHSRCAFCLTPIYYKDQYGGEGRKVILTFGLLSPSKGIETMIDALPAVVERHPEAVYVVLGATHLKCKRGQGEALPPFVTTPRQRIGSWRKPIFHNRFVELVELCEFLGAADILRDPLFKQGTDRFLELFPMPLDSGKATISTPYWYAEEMLAEGRGRIVPFQDPPALASM